MNIIGAIALVICGMLLTIFCIICFCVFANNYNLLNMLMNDPNDIGFHNINKYKIDDKYGKSK